MAMHVLVAGLLSLSLHVSVPSTPACTAGVSARLPTRHAVAVRASMCAEAPVVAEPKMESSCGFDFAPLAAALKEGDFLEADQLTRDGLITLAGEAAIKRGYVYFSEVPRLPEEDMATIERLWLAYSGGKFGYSVQASIFGTKRVNRDFEAFFERIGWKNAQGSLLRWLPDKKNNEFIYELDKAPEGHLPLTSALRGTQLLAGLLDHSTWQREEFAK